MFALAMIALVLGLVTLGASFFSHLRDYSSDVYDKVNEKSKKNSKKKDHDKKDKPPHP